MLAASVAVMTRNRIMTGRARIPWMALLLIALLGGCEREQREVRLDPPLAAALDGVALLPLGIGGRPPEVVPALGQPFDGNAYQLSEGKRLYQWFGCASCHADGQGGAGPSLIDGWWNYGADPATLYVTLRDGRPGGMPAFGSRLTHEQMWQLVGYLRVLGGYSGGAAAPGRADRVQTRPAENRVPAATAPH